jgi:hypothetical protein
LVEVGHVIVVGTRLKKFCSLADTTIRFDVKIGVILVGEKFGNLSVLALQLRRTVNLHCENLRKDRCHAHHPEASSRHPEASSRHPEGGVVAPPPPRGVVVVPPRGVLVALLACLAFASAERTRSAPPAGRKTRDEEEEEEEGRDEPRRGSGANSFRLRPGVKRPPR